MMGENEVEVLLVEDDPHDAELTLRALKKRGLTNRLERVADGAEALDFVFGTGAYSNRKAGDGPKLVLLDLRLPKVDGIEVLRQVRNNDFTKLLPIVILTSSQEEKDLIDGYRLGVNSYVRKPVDFNQFADAVRNLGLYWLLLNETPPVTGEKRR